MSKRTPTLFEEEVNTPIFKRFLPICKKISSDSYDINEWDIPYTIKQMSYLVHSHYRYYGKFPPAVAGQILEQLPPPSKKHYVLDNFCGSGTTLVEAKLRGINSFGTDISWLSVLVSNVKVSHLDIDKVKSTLKDLINNFNEQLSNVEVPKDEFVLKWFNYSTVRDLTKIQYFLLNLKKDSIRDFLLVAFISIVRRVSRAYDGEVRPHINKTKKQRDVLEAFSKKVLDMCEDHLKFMQLTDKSIDAKCLHVNNLNLPENFRDKKCYLVISHPPYLNSFNYAPVYSLEFYWGKPFESDYASSEDMQKGELKAHPASEKITTEYFEHLRKCYIETFNIQDENSYLAIVIGDCTRRGKVIPVINRLIDIIEDIGYKTIEVNYRTTHYGLGKYAYNHRADYHGNAEKKDGILIFKK